MGTADDIRKQRPGVGLDGWQMACPVDLDGRDWHLMDCEAHRRQVTSIHQSSLSCGAYTAGHL